MSNIPVFYCTAANSVYMSQVAATINVYEDHIRAAVAAVLDLVTGTDYP